MQSYATEGVDGMRIYILDSPKNPNYTKKGRVLLADAPNLDEIKNEALEMLDDKDWNEIEKVTDFSKLYIGL